MYHFYRFVLNDSKLYIGYNLNKYFDKTSINWRILFIVARKLQSWKIIKNNSSNKVFLSELSKKNLDFF